MPRAITRYQDVLALIRRRKPALVSFDLFDTLVYRTTVTPRDVFRIQGRRLRRLGVIDMPAEAWLDRRKQAERNLVRSLAPREVTLAQIYDRLLDAGELPTREARETAMALELAIEREVIRLFPFVPALLSAVKETQARVTVLSDIYLPQSFIRDILAPVSRWIDDIACSSETQATKRHGEAFARLKAHTSVLHFGDNPRSDVRRAKANGIDGRLIAWDRERWLRRSRAEIALLRLRGGEVPPLRDPGAPPAPGTLTDLATRWSIVLYDFLLDLRRQAKIVGASDIWLGSRDCESLWAVLRDFPGFFGPATVRYVRTSRTATHPLMANADPRRFAVWQKKRPRQVEPQAGILAQRYYQGLLRPETRRILFVDMISRGRIEASLRLALPPDVALSGYYFSLHFDQEASGEARVYLPWRHDSMHASAIEMLSGFSGGTCTGFRQTDDGAIEPTMQDAPKDTAPPIYLAALREALSRLIAADEVGDPVSRDDLLDARRKVVRPLTMFPDSFLAESLKGWHYSSPHDHPAHDIVRARTSVPGRLLALASRDNRWPAVALHSVAPPWLVPVLQGIAAGRMAILNRLDGVPSPRNQVTQMVGQDERG